MFRPQNVAVIGAGVIGASCALALVREGVNVTVFDQGPVGHGCSFGNGAQYNIGSALPMAYPGVIKQGLRWIFDEAGPVRISWRNLPNNLRWFYEFHRTSQYERWVNAYEHLHALNSPCVKIYRELLGDVVWQQASRASGALHVWRSLTSGPLDVEIERLREMHGVSFEHVNEDEIRKLEPALSTEFKRGIFFPGSGYVVSSVGLVERILEVATSCGVRFHKGLVQSITPTGSNFSLSVDSSVRQFDAVVVAAGYETKEIASKLGVNISMTSERGYHVTFPAIATGVNRPVTDAESAVVATPVSEGLRLVGIADFDAHDADPDFRQTEKLIAKARKMFPDLEFNAAERWMGIRPSMPDSLPVIDRHPKHNNLFFATGHGHMGISGAPMTAALISDMVCGRPPRIDTGSFKLR